MTKIGAKRKSPKKPMKRKLIKLLPLDIMFSKLIRAGADYTCEYCGKKSVNKQGLHCSHFIGRRYRNTRWLKDNCSCVCFGCHNFFHDFPAEHRDFFIKRLGVDRVEQLSIIARSGGKVDMELIKMELTEKLGRLENG